LDYKWDIPGKAENMVDILRYIANERGLSKEEIKKFITTSQEPHDPFLFNSMRPIIDRINKAIASNEQIIIIGDYDCDGVTSTYVMYRGLLHMNANVIYKLPHRLINGYGLKKPLVDYAHEHKATLIITVDNGVAANEAIKYAQDLGIDVIVTDHHEPQAILPDCLIIDPKVNKEYPFDGLCGCGVAFKVIQALIPDFENTPLYGHLMEILAIGTIADVMSLVDENRTFVIDGIKRLNNTTNVGLKQLFKLYKLEDKEIDVTTIGFFIGPNINVAGRLESPDLAIKLLLSDDEVEADNYAGILLKLNDKRKALQKEALSKIDVDPKNNCIIEIIESSNAGIGGVIASNVVGKYNRPCFVLHEHEGVATGSGRTFGDFNIMSCITNHLDLVIGGGGHKGACGMSIKTENLDMFQIECNKEFDKWLEKNPDGLVPKISATCEINFEDISRRLVSNFSRLKPFGMGNPEPIFMTTSVDVSSSRIVGKNQNVIQFVFKKGFNEVKAVGFENLKNKYIEMGSPKKIDILYNIGLNEWPVGEFSIQLSIIDIK
jgi:single-stranded-DNA-specific exonuclease